MRTNCFFKILLVLSFLLSSAFAAEGFNNSYCARQVLPPISSLSVDAKYALFEKRILISLKNITIEAYPRDKDIFDLTGNPQIAPQVDKLAYAQDWQQRLLHRYRLNIWNENYTEKITITVLLTMEFANPHDRDLFMNNLRIALSRSFTYEDLKRFVHESTDNENFTLRFQFLPEGISENLQSSYLKHAQVSLRKFEIIHKDGDSFLVSVKYYNTSEILLGEEYSNGVVPSVAQFFHWFINLRALKNVYDDPKLNKNFFSRQKFKSYKEETINQLLQDFSSALATAQKTVLNNLSSIDLQHLPSSRSEKSFLEMDSGKFIYPEAYIDSRLNDQQQVQHFLYWINPENPESIEYIPVEFGGIIPTNYEEGYWRNYVARLLVTMIPAKERYKLGKIVIIVKNDLEEIVPKVTPLPGSENKFAITIEIPPTAKLGNQKISVKNLIHSLGNLTHNNQADFGMHLAVSFIKAFAPQGTRIDYSLANVREHLSSTDEMNDFNPDLFIDHDTRLALSILSDNAHINTTQKDISLLKKYGNNESKYRYKNNRQWLEFYLIRSSRKIKIGVDTAVLPTQSPPHGIILANQQDQDVLKEFYEMVQEVLAPFLRVDIAPLLPTSVKFISYPEPLPEIKNIQKFTQKIGAQGKYYDKEIFRSTDRKVLVSLNLSKENSPTITVILAKGENLLADPPTMVKLLQSAVFRTIIDKIFVGPSRDEIEPTNDSIFSAIADRDTLRDAFRWVLSRIFFPEDKFDTDPIIPPSMEAQRFVWRYLETVRNMDQSSTRAEIEEIIAFIKNYLEDDFKQSPLLQGARDYTDNPQSYYFTKDLETLKDQLQEFIRARINNLTIKGNKGDSSKLSEIFQELKNIILELIDSPEFSKLSSDTQDFIRAYMRNVRNSPKNNFQGCLLQCIFKKSSHSPVPQRLNVSPLITIKDGQITFPIQWDSNQASFKIILPYDENQDISQTIHNHLLPILGRLNNKNYNFSEILKGNKELIFIYPDDQELIKVDDQFLLAVGSETLILTDQKQGEGRFSLLAGNSADGQRLYIVLPRGNSLELTIGDTTFKRYWYSSIMGDLLLAQTIQACFGKRDQVGQDKSDE